MRWILLNGGLEKGGKKTALGRLLGGSVSFENYKIFVKLITIQLLESIVNSTTSLTNSTFVKVILYFLLSFSKGMM